ncbi:MAG TPA: hypothetical protein VG937_00140 [Polyangiaceae bacterium]|nr:hypothetical protein [Polyangiaceae bacterium]
MSFSKFFISSVFASAMAIPLAANADSAQCELRANHASHVAPLRAEQRLGRSTISKLVGAQVFVPARAGLTAEWLRTRVEAHAASMQSSAMPGCPLSVNGVHVTVASGGTGFWVQLTSKDPSAAAEVLRRAAQIVR